MNLLIISPNIYPCVTGGVEIFNYYFVGSIAKKVDRVLVFSDCAPFKSIENLLYVKLKKREFFGACLFSDLFLFINIFKFKKYIDIIHVPYTSNSHLVYPVLLANKLFCIPYIITIHGGGMHPWKPKRIHNLFFKKAAAIVAVSKTIKTEYEKRSNRVIKEIPPLIPFNRANKSKKELRDLYGFEDNDIIILSLGSIKKIKGNDILLSAFFNLGMDYINTNGLKLLFVGDGPMKVKLEDEVKFKKMDKYIKFTGKLPHEIIPQMYKLADVFVISSFFEGTPISMLEAMFNGIPIIGSNANGINDIIIDNETGLLFEIGNPDELKEKIELIVNNKYLLSELAEAAKRKYLKYYSFEDVVLEHINLMESILGNREKNE